MQSSSNPLTNLENSNLAIRKERGSLDSFCRIAIRGLVPLYESTLKFEVLFLLFNLCFEKYLKIHQLFFFNGNGAFKIIGLGTITNIFVSFFCSEL